MTVGFKDKAITDPCNQTGFGPITPKFLLDATKRPVNEFLHNNMVPYYGAHVTQNTQSTSASIIPTEGNVNETPWKQKLGKFTGCDEMYMYKRETGPMFSPQEQQTSWVRGSPAIRPDLDRYKISLTVRNNEAPTERIQVGPGIALKGDKTMIPAIGGYQQFTRILPNNVSDYKANQLEGRVKAGKWFVNLPTSQYTEGVQQKLPKLIVSQNKRPTFQGKFYTNAPSGNTNITDHVIEAMQGKQARSDTGQRFFGDQAIGLIAGSVVPNPRQNENASGLRETFKKSGIKLSGDYYVQCENQGENRFDLTLGGPVGLIKNGEDRDGKYWNYTNRGENNPYISINPTGDNQWSPNSFQDQQKVTRKETTHFSHAGNVEGSKIWNNNSFQDQQKVTRKETTEYSHAGNPEKQGTAFMDRFFITG